MVYINSALNIPIYRKDGTKGNYLEFITADEFATLFPENNLEDELEVSSLGIHLISSQGIKLLTHIYKRHVEKRIRIITERGKVLILPAKQKVAILDNFNHNNRFHNFIDVDKLSEGDTLIEFAGEFNNVFAGMEYIDLINTLIKVSPKDKLSEISVTGVKEYLRSVNNFDQSKLVNSMEFSKFSSIMEANGVYEEELDYFKLSTKDNELQVASKLHLTNSLFEFLGYFWRYGTYTSDIPNIVVSDYKIARKIARLIKKALNAGVTIVPISNARYIISLHSSIFTRILKDIFELTEDTVGIKLPARIFNSDNEFISAFITSIIIDNTIDITDNKAVNQIIFLLNILGIYPNINYKDKIYISLSENDIKLINGDREEEELPIDKIQSIEDIKINDDVTYLLNCGSTYFAGPGILLYSMSEEDE